jgi:hypothetical protein
MSQVKEMFKLRLKEVGDMAIKETKYFGIGYDDIVSSYEELGMECPIMVRKSRMALSMTGWGNGYVRIPEGHVYYGMGYEDISYDVHGGLTFSEVIKENDSHNWPKGHWIGFDTAHSGDTKENWSKEQVVKETINLFLQTLN